MLERLEQCEEDKLTKDSQIRNLKEEYNHQVRTRDYHFHWCHILFLTTLVFALINS